MKYVIPPEAPPGRFATLAVQPFVPLLAVFVTGTLPAIIWAAANSYFLGCRDARKQTAMLLVGFLAIKSLGLLSSVVRTAPAVGAFAGPAEVKLATAILSNSTFLVLGLVLAWAYARQTMLADYRNRLGKKLPFGITAIVLLAAVNFLVVPLVGQHIPYFPRFWGKMI